MLPLLQATLDWADYAPYYAALEATDLSPTSLRAWLSAWSDVERTLHGLETQLRNAANADLSDKRAHLALDTYSTTLKPAAQAAANRLKAKYLATGIRDPEFDEMTRAFAAEARLYHPDNAPLLAEDEVRGSEFNRSLSELTVNLEVPVPYGETLGMLSDSDRAVRERAWRARQAALEPRRGEYDALFLDLVTRRERIARIAEFPNYRDYRWLEYGRFDYRPSDTRLFAEGIEQEVLPLLHQARERRRKLLGVTELRPWDTQVYPFPEPLSSPFEDADDVLAKADTLLGRIDPEMQALLRRMVQGGTVDMALRPNKALTDLADYDYLKELPTIFTYCTGDVQDLKYFVHEFGHCFHYHLTMTQPFYWQQWGRLEVMEFAAQSVELLTWPYLGEIFAPDDLEPLMLLAVERILADLALVPILDQLQDWIYLQDASDLTAPAIDQVYLELARRFDDGVDWRGLDGFRCKGWQSRHLFQWPFYYIEYGLAWIGALDFYGQYLRAPSSALRGFKKALSLGSSRPVHEIIREAGSVFPPGPADVARATSELAKALDGAPRM